MKRFSEGRQCWHCHAVFVATYRDEVFCASACGAEWRRLRAIRIRRARASGLRNWHRQQRMDHMVREMRRKQVAIARASRVYA